MRRLGGAMYPCFDRPAERRKQGEKTLPFLTVQAAM
jgi:hypothetical protein